MIRIDARAWLWLMGLAVLVPIQPAARGLAFPPIWFPAAGVALALVAWFGRRAALLPLAAGLSTAGWLILRGSDGPAVAGAIADGAIAALEALAGCWLFLGLARGGRRLSDPGSAVEFLLLVPGLAAAGGAAVRAGVAAATGLSLTPGNLAALWLGHALGLLAVAPPLLTCLTPWLVRRGLTEEDASDAAPPLPGPVGADGITLGDAVEIAGLALCAGGLGLLLALAPGHRMLAGWQVWGAPMLLIVWASLRQGLRGGTTVACAGVAVPLAVSLAGQSTASITLLLQGNLLAQAGTGLLVAASASWLRSSERRYRQLVAHVPVVVYSVRLAGNPAAAEISLVSAASADLLGCPPDQFLGDHGRWLEHVHPEDREVLRAAITQLERQQQPVTCEYRFAPIVPKDWLAVADLPTPRSRTGVAAGSALPAIRWVRDTLAPRRDDEGRLTGWEGVVADITEQRSLADDLRRASSMLHALVTNLPAGVFFVQGPGGRPILVNARARELLGQREEAILAHISSVYRLHRPDGTPYPVEELPVARALKDGRTTMCDDIVAHRPDGRRVRLVSWAAPVEMSGPETNAAVWVLQDLTALQKVEAIRREAENPLRAIVETMGEALLVLDQKGKVVDANPAATDLFGSEPAAVLDRSLSDLGWTWLREDGSPLSDDEHPAKDTLRTNRPVRGAVIGLRRDGTTGPLRWVHVNAMPLGNPAAGVVVTLSDITRFRQQREGI